MTAKNIKNPSIEGDAYFTPKWAVKLALNHIIPEICAFDPKTILEPGAGEGVFIDALRERFPESVIHGFDINTTCQPWPGADLSMELNFLEEEDRRHLPGLVHGDYDLAIGNPPYTYAQEFIEHSLRLSHHVVFLLRQGFLSSVKRHSFFQKHKPTNIYCLANRPKFIKGKSGDTADYCFVCFRNPTYIGARDYDTIWRWLPVVSLEERKLG